MAELLTGVLDLFHHADESGWVVINHGHFGYGWMWGASAVLCLLVPELVRLYTVTVALLGCVLWAYFGVGPLCGWTAGGAFLALFSFHIIAGLLRGFAWIFLDVLHTFWKACKGAPEAMAHFDVVMLTPELWFRWRKIVKAEPLSSPLSSECKAGVEEMIVKAVRAAVVPPGLTKEMANPSNPFSDTLPLPKCMFHIVSINGSGEGRHVGFGSFVQDDVFGGPSIVTAYHVVTACKEWNERVAFQRGDLRMEVTLCPVEVIPILDFARLAVPPNMGSLLGVRIGKVGNFSRQKPVTVYSLPEAGKDVTRYRVSRSMAHPEPKFCSLRYAASTLPGSSGSPLFQGSAVVGVHTHALPIDGKPWNYGTTFLRLNRRAAAKESSESEGSRNWNLVDDLVGPTGRFARYTFDIDGNVADVEYYDFDERDIMLRDQYKEGGVLRWEEIDQAEAEDQLNTQYDQECLRPAALDLQLIEGNPPEVRPENVPGAMPSEVSGQNVPVEGPLEISSGSDTSPHSVLTQRTSRVHASTQVNGADLAVAVGSLDKWAQVKLDVPERTSSHHKEAQVNRDQLDQGSGEHVRTSRVEGKPRPQVKFAQSDFQHPAAKSPPSGTQWAKKQESSSRFLELLEAAEAAEEETRYENPGVLPPVPLGRKGKKVKENPPLSRPSAALSTLADQLASESRALAAAQAVGPPTEPPEDLIGELLTQLSQMSLRMVALERQTAGGGVVPTPSPAGASLESSVPPPSTSGKNASQGGKRSKKKQSISEPASDSSAK